MCSVEPHEESLSLLCNNPEELSWIFHELFVKFNVFFLQEMDNMAMY